MPAPDRPDAEWAKSLLRENGLRATAARIAVMRHLATFAGPQSHADVVQALRENGFDQSTLFRCLNELADAGVVARLDLGDQVRRFELTGAENEGAAEHAHFMCVDCGQLSCLSGFTFKLTPDRGSSRKKLGAITEVLLRGHCEQCAG